MIDLHHIDARHDAINLRLEQWARWVTPRPQAWKMQPMFRLYKAPPQWEPRELRVEVNPNEAMEIERIVAQLPETHRLALRWYYVFPWVSVGKVRQAAGQTREGLYRLVVDSRDMVKNRLRQHLHTSA